MALNDKIDYRLLDARSDLVICSRCLRSGKVTPIPQVITRKRAPVNLCAACRGGRKAATVRAGTCKVLPFPV